MKQLLTPTYTSEGEEQPEVKMFDSVDIESDEKVRLFNTFFSGNGNELNLFLREYYDENSDC